MSGRKVFSVNFIGFLLLLFCLAHRAFSRKCYSCASTFNRDCTLNPQQEKFVMDCGLRGFGPNNSHVHFPDDDGEDYINCATKVAMYEGEEVTERFCTRKEISCEDTVEVDKALIKLISCDDCTTDLCNGIPVIKERT